MRFLGLLPFALVAMLPLSGLFSREPVRQSRSAEGLQLQGAGSCSAAACHNADAPTGFTGREYAVAMERDPQAPRQTYKDRHVQAYDVLHGPHARAIQRNLASLTASEVARPEVNPLCLRCHVHPDFDRNPIREVDGVPQFRLEDGVSCEACHGPAQRWLAEHFRPGWKTLSAAQRQARGMADTRSLAGRVRLCVDCHVGSGKDMEVNHDLIAAGHPRLAFEFGSFHFTLHKHWAPARDVARVDFEARAWTLGQVYSAQAALKLLAGRAGDESHVWPELAEYDCFACHHDLQPKSSRPRPVGERKPGQMPWNSWYYAMLPSALEARSEKTLTRLLEEIRTEMERPRPERKRVAERARHAAGLLEGSNQLDLDRLTQRIEDRISGICWDEAAQGYLALSAVDRARRDAKRPPLRSLSVLEDLLRFPEGFDSPRHFSPEAFEFLRSTLRKGPSRER